MIMRDEERAKKTRKAKETAFKKRTDALKKLVMENAAVAALEDAFKDCKIAYAALEEAHETYSIEADEATIVNEGDFLGPHMNTVTYLQKGIYGKKATVENDLAERLNQLEIDKVQAAAKANEDARKEGYENEKKARFASVKAMLTTQGPSSK